jgi:aminoglycoside phosphotransferase (APT) family kinase protein
LRLRRTKYKPGRSLSAYYDLALAEGTRPVAVQWSMQSGAPATVLEDTGSGLPPPAGLACLSASSDDQHTALSIAPADPAMPQLARLAQPDHLRTVLSHLNATPPVPAADISFRYLRYRPRQRHVLRVECVTPNGVEVSFVKIDRDNRAAHAVRVADTVASLLSAATPHAGLVQAWGYVDADRASVWRSAAGSLLTTSVCGTTSAAGPLAALGAGLRALHDLDRSALVQPGGDALGLPSHDATAEMGATVRAGEHLTGLLPALALRYLRLAGQVMDRLSLVSDEAPTLTHGDLKCDNVIAHRNTLRLLDLDRCGWGDPALDLGKLLADLRWWGRWAGADVAGLTAALLDGYGPTDAARWQRARLLAVLFELKFAARRAAVHDPAWRAQVEAQVTAAEAAFVTELVSG